jgi:CreA protein
MVALAGAAAGRSAPPSCWNISPAGRVAPKTTGLSMFGKCLQFARIPMTSLNSGLRAWMLVVALMLAGFDVSPGRAADEPDLIFKRSTVFKWLTPDDKLATYGLDDPEVDGVACHFTVPEKGGLKGWLGVAEEVSDISLACRQIAPIRFKKKFAQGEDVFRTRRSLFFKKMQIVRGCDTKRNVLVYMVYSDKLIDGSPKNSTSSVPVMPWGSSDEVQKCADWVE